MLFEEFMEKAVKEFYSLTKDYERTYNLLKFAEVINIIILVTLLVNCLRIQITLFI